MRSEIAFSPTAAPVRQRPALPSPPTTGSSSGDSRRWCRSTRSRTAEPMPASVTTKPTTKRMRPRAIFMGEGYGGGGSERRACENSASSAKYSGRRSEIGARRMANQKRRANREIGAAKGP